MHLNVLHDIQWETLVKRLRFLDPSVLTTFFMTGYMHGSLLSPHVQSSSHNQK